MERNIKFYEILRLKQLNLLNVYNINILIEEILTNGKLKNKWLIAKSYKNQEKSFTSIKVN